MRSLIAALVAGSVVSLAPAGEQAELLPDYPLEIMNIKAVGTGGMEASNRIFRAYPGLRYNIRAAVIGGRYPYTFRLVEAPEGMIVNARTGEVDWPEPRATAKARLEVTDSAGKKITAGWTVTVTKDKFIFVDAKKGRRASEGATGTIENPFRTIADFYPDDEQKGLRTSKYTDYAVYFREGTYKLDGFKSGWGGIRDKAWMNFRDQHPNVLMAYPGEEAAIDCESKHSLVVYPQPGFWIEGLRFRGMRNFKYALEIEAGGRHLTVRKVDFEGLGPTTGHNNQSFIRIRAGGRALENLVVQDCRFHDLDHGSGIKLYCIDRALIEDNTFTDFKDTSTGGGNLDGAVAMKVCVKRCVFRGNIISGFTGGRAISCLFSQPYRGKFYAGVSENEVCYNLAHDIRKCMTLSINAYANPGSTDVYRNTFVGPMVVLHVGIKAGPFRFYRNVYVREGGGGKVDLRKVSDPSRVVQRDNLVVSRSELDDKLLLRDEAARRKYGHWLPAPPEAPAKAARPKPERGEDPAAPGADHKAAELYRAARDAERRGMRSLARTLYGRLLSDHPKSQLAERARSRLELMN